MKYYKLSEHELRLLLEANERLLLLEEAGVDNWQGRDYAYERLLEEYPEAEDVSECIEEEVNKSIKNYKEIE